MQTYDDGYLPYSVGERDHRVIILGIEQFQ